MAQAYVESMPKLAAKSRLPQSAGKRSQEVFLFRLFRTCFTLQASLDRRFLKSGVTFQEAVVLLHCVQNSWVTPGRLALALGRDKGKITRFVDRLVARGLVVRELNPPDRRITRILPTNEGKLTARRIATLFERVRKELFAHIGIGDLRRTENMLPRLYDNAVKLGRKGRGPAGRLRLKGRAEEKEQQDTAAIELTGSVLGIEIESEVESRDGDSRPPRITKAQVDDLFPR
jgi:DNA-binding MarR family transcriptional regulator